MTAKPATTLEDDPYVVINIRPGVSAYGEICAASSAAAGVPQGEIRLLNGYPGAKGWGYRHITSNPDRMKLISRAGYTTAQAFAYAVSQNWVTLHAGPSGPAIRVTVAMPPANGLQLAVALNWREPYWSITTMLPFRTVNYPILYRK